ncbi:two-component system, NarL family, sensor histidine kinase DesK [Amphibacillus marinus]|uniref:histidine kinase n=1 Tax=Amphibacillus marinus TaxID=872970 RepID=A0A1H8L3K3_9BACI|nr:sensor histidine kinase [Amphibacillus marinus]SEN99416.1 two-component system, NarL family, sensor histidine kinase DesK [Amphibacillus marinus]
MFGGKLDLRIFPKRYGYFPYVFLIYLLFPAYLISLESNWIMVIGWGLLILFLISYRQIYVSIESSAFSYWLIVQILIIFMFTLFNVNNIFLGYFPAYFLSWYRDNKSFYLAYTWFIISLLLALIINYQSFINAGSLFYLIYLMIMVIVPFGIKSMNSRIELEKKLTEANERIEELIKRDERMRIARDLHDTLGHTFSLVTLKAQLVSKLVDKDAKRARIEASEIERISRIALTQVRELVSDMRSLSIAEVLVESETILQSAGITFQLKGEGIANDIPSISQNILSMCLKEAVTNVVKHSEARNCCITLKQLSGKIQLVIEDDGIGFDKKGVNGNGLHGISERLELVDGKLEVQVEQGSTLTVTIPIVTKNKEAALSS